MATTIDFTNRALDALKPPPAGRLEFKDTKIPGLYLRVTTNGVKTFSFVGRAKGSSRVERVTLGRYPIVKADEARRQAAVLAGDLAAGMSPATAARRRRTEPTLGEVFRLFKASKELRGRKAVAQDDDAWRLYIEPAFGPRRLSEITTTAVERWHRTLPAAVMKRREERAAIAQAAAEAEAQRRAESRALRRRGPDPKPQAQSPQPSRKITGERTANIALALLRSVYNWAMAPKQGLFIGPNPAAGHETFVEASRERFLRPDELAPFFSALSAEPSQTMRDFILLALLTGARRSNLAAVAWADLDLGRAEWTVPGNLMKNGQRQTITLTPEAVGILRNREGQQRLPRKPGARPSQRERLEAAYVFPSPKSTSGHIEEPRAAWRRVLQTASIADLTIHDLRRTLGSWQARTGASLVLIGKSLNHKDQQSTAIYARLDLDPVRQSIERATTAMFQAAGIRDTAQYDCRLNPPCPSPIDQSLALAGESKCEGAAAGYERLRPRRN